jgi:mRNA interferase MazF
MVDFSPGRGSERKGMRPALVIQNDVGNIHARTTILAAITTTIKKYPVTVVLNRNEGGLKQASMVNLAQILTVDKSRLVKKVGAVSQVRLEEIDAALLISLGVGES